MEESAKSTEESYQFKSIHGQLKIVSSTLDRDHSKALWTEFIAKHYTKHFFHLKRIHFICAILYFFLSIFVYCCVAILPFNTNAGVCLETRLPLGYLIATFYLITSIESISYVIAFSSYVDSLREFQNPRRWTVRIFSSILNAIFVTELVITCGPNIANTIAGIAFLIGVNCNFLSLQEHYSFELATRAYRYILTRRKDDMANVIAKCYLSTSKKRQEWLKAVSPVFTSCFLLLYFLINTGSVGRSNASWQLFAVYGFGILELICIFGLYGSFYNDKEDRKLFQRFLQTEKILTCCLFICSAGIGINYTVLTRLM